jgi:DNA polymerase-4
VAEFGERIAHVDMDAFFVEVERLRRPELHGVPVAVGGAGSRGVVASASYEARHYGIRSAMPMIHARRRCPHLRVVPPDHRRYAEISGRVFAVLESFTPLVEPLSVDEAFLDIGGLRHHYASPAEIGEAVRGAIRAGTGLPASVGIATIKLLAKLASEDAKPDGLLVVAKGTERAYLHPKPVRALWGVGEATYARLEELGVQTVGDLSRVPRSTLERRLGGALGGLLAALADAEDDRPVTPGSAAKSISVEETFPEDLEDAAAVERELLRLSRRLASRLRRAGMAARTVSLKVRFADFATISRSQTEPSPVDSGHRLYAAALRLLRRAGIDGRPVRLLGVGGESLVAAAGPRQLDLAGAPWNDLEDAVEEVQRRFGEGAVTPARLVERPEDPQEPEPPERV